MHKHNNDNGIRSKYGCNIVVAVAGNPNVGKSTLFNVLTGEIAHVANWPGVTVERKEGIIKGGINSVRENSWLACYSKKLGNKWERIEWSYHEAIEEAHGGPMFELINAVLENREPSNSGRDNLNTMRFCLAALISLRKGIPVDLKEIG